ncbi:unnamed protein product [Lactuca virosa]|uniref:Protein kinase domain-containing protein n=1 Tax=Lactuca virosa TaxID=75947 RepID=A0AAU9PHJ7_9ASTR|nr:unnamed protein product [Lactuca virosa]
MFPAIIDGKESQPSTCSSIESSQPCRHFELHEILLATDNLDESLVIGHGGFGKVYKGNITNGSIVSVAAIKRLDPMSSQGASEFWAEVEMLSNFRHCHLVSLFGYCNHKKEMILVYEYMPNGTLEDHLHNKLGTPLSWLQRLKICIGAARGLDYLHTGTGIKAGVIHRDVKSSNILLDKSWAAKISDFGLSKIGPKDQPLTYVNTHVKGTFGYLDPDYSFTGRLTRKSDVYAFGVVLLEVLCGRPALDLSLDEDEQNLARWAQESIKEGNLKHIIDSGIRDQISPKSLKEFVRIAGACLHSKQKERPTMTEVVFSLASVLILQEKTNSSLQPSHRTVFSRMVDKFPFTSNGDNSVRGDPSDSKANNRNAAADNVGSDDKDFTMPILTLKVFDFADLELATRRFSQDMLIATEGYGETFLGWVDKNTLSSSTEGLGIAVAVERCHNLHEWQTVLSVLGQLAHPNIISLLGYCNNMKEEERWLLVYENMQNQNLGHFLFGGDVAEPLPWATRLMIMIGVARGLAYIHSSKRQLIHRDVKSSNILLDQDFNAKLGGFELARFFPETETGKTVVSTSVMGTYHYADPVYINTGRLSVKSDIYGFGVVLLEILTGRRATVQPSPQTNLVKWASSSLASRSKLKKIMDPCLKQKYPPNGAFRCAALVLRCLSEDQKDRPSSEEVLGSLEQIYAINK